MNKFDDIVASTVHNCNGGDCMVREFADALIEALKGEIRNLYKVSKSIAENCCDDVDLAYSKLKEGKQ